MVRQDICSELWDERMREKEKFASLYMGHDLDRSSMVPSTILFLMNT